MFTNRGVFSRKVSTNDAQKKKIVKRLTIYEK